MSFRDWFSVCKLTPVAGSEPSSSSVVLSSDGKWKASSFYLDTSGRSSISLPLRLEFPSREILQLFVGASCFKPPPPPPPPPSSHDVQSSNESNYNAATDSITTTQISVGIEAKVTLTFGTGSARTATVEGVTILSTRIGDGKDDNNNDDESNHPRSIYFQTEIVIRVSKGSQDQGVGSDSNDVTTSSSSNKHSTSNDSESSSKVKTNLEISAVLLERSNLLTSSNQTSSKIHNSTNGGAGSMVSPLDALRLINMHYGSSGSSGSSSQNSNQATSGSNLILTETRLNPPFALHVELTHALAISVRAFDGPKMGQTFLSLTMSHSNTHHQPVTITSIALHPGHSRYKPFVSADFDDNKTGDSNHSINMADNTASTATTTKTTTTTIKSSMVDMSKIVKWGYALGSDPHLPLTLQRNEAYSTIVTIDASEDTMSRSCVCPLSITAIIGTATGATSTKPFADQHSNEQQQHPPQQKQEQHYFHDRKHFVVAAVEASWSSTIAPIEPTTDSFRIELSFSESTTFPCTVGAILTVELDVFNLSSESKELMLLIDSASSSSSTFSPSKAVVASEQGGYKFGVGGLSSLFSSTASSTSSRKIAVRDTPDESKTDLILVDQALVLGEVKGHSSTKGKVRVIPLREGTLRIPNFKLVDKYTGKWYSCCHRMDAVSIAPSFSSE